jgi:hypothetical protein
MVRALQLDWHIAEVKRIHLTFNVFKFPIGTYKFLAGEAGVNNSSGPQLLQNKVRRGGGDVEVNTDTDMAKPI